MTETKKWKKEEIQDLINRRDDAVSRGMQRIFELQTLDEQDSGYTKWANGVDFSGAHGEIMSSFVEFYNKRKFLSPKQMKIARRIMLRYAGQLAKIVNGKITTSDV